MFSLVYSEKFEFIVITHCLKDKDLLSQATVTLGQTCQSIKYVSILFDIIPSFTLEPLKLFHYKT